MLQRLCAPRAFCTFWGTPPSFVLVQKVHVSKYLSQALRALLAKPAHIVAYAGVSLRMYEYDSNHVDSSFARSQHAPSPYCHRNKSTNDWSISLEPGAI
jgi:hypothetical protein